MANPAIAFFLEPPAGVSFPYFVDLSANSVRLYFDEPSQIGVDGPTKFVRFDDPDPVSVWISIFPDRDFNDEEYVLTLEYLDANFQESTQTLPIRVVDQDVNRPLDVEIRVTFTEDKSGFFDSPDAREVIEQAARARHRQ